jgi:hypothetical protein
MDDLVLKLRILIRAETAIRESQLRLVGRQSVAIAIGIVLALLALGAVNLAIYVALAEHFSEIAAGLILALLNGVLAVIFILAAGRMKTGPEVAMAEQMRELALNELSADADQLKQELQKVTDDVRHIRDGFSRIVRGDLSQLGLPNLSPLLSVLFGALKGRKK